MHKDSYLRSKIPVPLVLLFVLNVFLVMALEILLLYPHPAELTPEYLADYDSAYKNCSIISADKSGTLHCWLIKTESGDYRMIPTQHHGLISGRTKILKNQIASVPADAEETEITVRTGVHSSLIAVRQVPLEGYTVENAERYIHILYHSSGNMSGTTTIYMVIAAILEFLELALWQLIKPQ